MLLKGKDNMKRFYIFSIGITLVFLVLISILTGCADISTVSFKSKPSTDNVEISYVADFYDNYGKQWFSIGGTSFNIAPNKVKEYYYDSDGSWISGWTTSSVMSITIDGHDIETCGSTVIFYDTRLEKIETDFNNEINLSTGNSYEVSTPSDIDYNMFWDLRYWWISSKQNNKEIKDRAVIIQSQNGDPICMFQGNNVSWKVSEQLPKTTEVIIDDMPVYIHRANFSIIDLAILKE